MDISLPFSFHWTAACYQDVTSLVIRQLGRQGLNLLQFRTWERGMQAVEVLSCFILTAGHAPKSSM